MQTQLNHNWTRLDNLRQYKYRQDRLQTAKKLGFSHISEATIKLYRKHRSLNKTAEILKISMPGVRSELANFGEPIRGRGGPHNGNSILSAWYNHFYDAEKFFLGVICLRSHDWDHTGKSLRYKIAGHCILCQRLKYNVNISKQS